MENVQTVKCITPEVLNHLIQNNSALVKLIDVRNSEEFSAKHIPGAINIPVSELESASLSFRKDDLIVTVCNKGGGRSEMTAKKLKEAGFLNAAWLCGGTLGWFEKK